MSEWWTYTLSDFLMFSPRTYYRLFALYNREIWPGQIVAAVAGLAALLLLRRGDRAAMRAICGLLAVAWLWVAFAFLLQRYDSINWAGRYLAAGFAVQGLALGLVALAARTAQAPGGDATARLGLALFLVAQIGYPLVAPIAGRPWDQAELFALAPDPTAIGTLGLMLALLKRGAILLAIVPLLWCAVSALTLWAMASVEALLPAAAALAAVVALAARRAAHS